MAADPRPDEELIETSAGDPEAFAVFYRRHLAAVVRYFMARTRDAELSIDLTAESFAAAMAASDRYDRRKAPARAWLYVIAHSKLVDSLRRGRVENSARRELGIRALAVTDEDIARVEEMTLEDQPALELLGELPEEMRAAVSARVIDERDYAEIAADLRCSESVVRKRVSRGLARLRAHLEESP